MRPYRSGSGHGRALSVPAHAGRHQRLDERRAGRIPLSRVLRQLTQQRSRDLCWQLRRIRRGGGGASWTWLYRIAAGVVVARNGRRPVAARTRRLRARTDRRLAPTLHPAAVPAPCIPAVPITPDPVSAVPPSARAIPKSTSVRWSFGPTIALLGLTSRWTTPLACAASRADASPQSNRNARSTGAAPRPDAVLQRPSGHQLHRDEVDPSRGPDVVDLHDIRMPQSGPPCALRDEPLDQHSIGGQVRR